MGLKSVLTGDGSDEFFLGYERHVCWFTKSKKEAQSEYPRWLWTATPDEAHELYLPWVQEHIKPMPTFKNINEVLRFERWERLQEYHCSRLDRMTMAWGVEAKVPFLDHRLVEYSLKVPLKKLFGKTGKEWLQDIARPYLPQEIIRRPKVHFPSLPNEWLSGKGVDWMSSILLDRGAKVAVFLNKKTLEKYIQQHKSGEIKHGRLLWALVSLELWLDRYPFSHF